MLQSPVCTVLTQTLLIVLDFFNEEKAFFHWGTQNAFACSVISMCLSES